MSVEAFPDKLSNPFEKKRPKQTSFSSILFFYILKRFSFAFIGFFVGLSGLIYLITLVEVADDLEGTGASFWVISQLVLCRLPELAEEIMPFMVLFSAMATFWRLNKSSELIIIKASGTSVWGILLPFAVGATLIGVLAFSVLNPLSAALHTKNREIMQEYKGGEYNNSLNLSESGLWLRQLNNQDDSLLTIHAKTLDQQTFELSGVMVLALDKNEKFTGRYDSQTASLDDGFWVLKNGWYSRPGKQPEAFETHKIPTRLTLQKIQDSFANPKAISFWQLRYYIDLLQTAGFTADKHRLQFHRQISKPALFLSMVLLAAIFSMRHHRKGGVGKMILYGALTGFLLFFLSNFVIALGQSGKIPAYIAAWTPAAVSMMLGLTMLLHLEDG